MTKCETDLSDTKLRVLFQLQGVADLLVLRDIDCGHSLELRYNS